MENSKKVSRKNIMDDKIHEKGSSKFSFEYVRQYFEDHGCKLLETEYKNSKSPLKYICSCGNKDAIISFNAFRNGKRCKKCKSMRTNRKVGKYTLDYVSRYFSDRGCTLLEEKYINATTPMKYICSCGNKSEICFNSFRQGHRCKKCGAKKSAQTNRKYNIKELKKVFDEQGCELLATEYINGSSPMLYRCDCGNIDKICLDAFLTGCRCWECGREKVKEALRNKQESFEEVKGYFEEQGCKLLEKEYINVDTPMKYICSCGKPSKITYYSFKLGHRCKKCSHAKTSEKKRTDFQLVKDYFENQGYALLVNQYTNGKKRLDCLCPRGHLTSISWGNFKRGKRCYICNESKGERSIKEFLEKCNITFERQYKFQDCKSINPLPFDFALFKNGKIVCLIEYDGEQHFQSKDFFGGENGFLERLQNDNMKNSFCMKNEIPLIRCYWQVQIQYFWQIIIQFFVLNRGRLCPCYF